MLLLLALALRYRRRARLIGAVTVMGTGAEQRSFPLRWWWF